MSVLLMARMFPLILVSFPVSSVFGSVCSRSGQCDVEHLRLEITSRFARFACMHQDGQKLDFIDAYFGGGHNTALGAWQKR